MASLHQGFVSTKCMIIKLINFHNLPIQIHIYKRKSWKLHLAFTLTLFSNNNFRCSLCSDASFVFHWYFINFMGCIIVHFLLMTYF